MADNIGGMLPQYFIGCDADYAHSRTVLFGAPFDGTVTFRPGSRFAPAAMRGDSWGLEDYSPYQDSCLEDCSIHDAGDLDLPFGNTKKALDHIGGLVEVFLNDGKKTLMIGGEHLVTLPAVQAMYKVYPDLCLLHFDAHTDLRDEYLGETFSHASVMRRSWELLGDGRIWQFGIRSGTREEFMWADAGHTSLHKYDLNGLEEAVNAIGKRPVYVTIDLDVLDPSVMPGTGTPEAGGVNFKELLGAILIMSGMNIKGADIVELAPHYDTSGASTAVACKVLRELAIIMG